MKILFICSLVFLSQAAFSKTVAVFQKENKVIGILGEYSRGQVAELNLAISGAPLRAQDGSVDLRCINLDAVSSCTLTLAPGPFVKIQTKKGEARLPMNEIAEGSLAPGVSLSFQGANGDKIIITSNGGLLSITASKR